MSKVCEDRHNNTCTEQRCATVSPAVCGLAVSWWFFFEAAGRVAGLAAPELDVVLVILLWLAFWLRLMLLLGPTSSLF